MEKVLSIPVKVGQQLVVSIIATGIRGDGIAKVQGYVLMVPEAMVGDKPLVEVVKILPKVGFAKVV